MHPGIESWLEVAAADFRMLSQREYRVLVAEWRRYFEESLVAGEYLVGGAAQRAIEQAMPGDMFVFRVPGYKWLPAATDPRNDPAYAYRTTELKKVEFLVANAADAILVDQGFAFTYLSTHEAGVLAQPRFLARCST